MDMSRAQISLSLHGGILRNDFTPDDRRNDPGSAASAVGVYQSLSRLTSYSPSRIKPFPKVSEHSSKRPRGRRPRSPSQAPQFANSQVHSGKTGSFEVYSSPMERGRGHRPAS